ncbi:hypothetical protein LEMLEM_LOCUS11904, partial [Lemmus lemmus]
PVSPTSQRPATASWKHRVGGRKEGIRRIHTLPRAGRVTEDQSPGCALPAGVLTLHPDDVYFIPQRSMGLQRLQRLQRPTS